MVIETGLSDFHCLTVTTMKVIIYRNYKNINNDKFRADLFLETNKAGRY